MAEIIYIYNKNSVDNKISTAIRWLEVEKDYDIFNRHLELCGQKSISKSDWEGIHTEGTMYCGLFMNEIMVARACVEKYSDEYWEVADVRVAQKYRHKGYAKVICKHVLDIIMKNGKKATIRTEEDNFIMQKTIASLGFVRK